jgi:hypothetical protein
VQAVRAVFASVLRRRAANVAQAPEDGVARGAALLARAIADERGTRHPMRVSEVLGSSVALCCRDGTPIATLDRNNRAPVSKRAAVAAATESVRYDVFQGDPPTTWMGAVEFVPGQGEEIVLAAAADGTIEVSRVSPEGLTQALTPRRSASAPMAPRGLGAPLETAPARSGSAHGWRRFWPHR